MFVCVSEPERDCVRACTHPCVCVQERNERTVFTDPRDACFALSSPAMPSSCFSRTLGVTGSGSSRTSICVHSEHDDLCGELAKIPGQPARLKPLFTISL